MSNLVVMAFDNEYGAEQVRDKLVDLQKAQLIKIDDACVVVRKQDGKVKVKQAANLARWAGPSGACSSACCSLSRLLVWLLELP